MHAWYVVAVRGSVDGHRVEAELLGQHLLRVGAPQRDVQPEEPVVAQPQLGKLVEGAVGDARGVYPSQVHQPTSIPRDAAATNVRASLLCVGVRFHRADDEVQAVNGSGGA